ncbi:MAG: hypothetical protein ABIT37_19140 [Luteolibacter sp.]
MKSETRQKIKTAISQAIPGQQVYKIFTSATGFDGTEVVRVVTPAWKNLGKAERIAKIQSAVREKLTSSELSRIFRFSVLTPNEWETVRAHMVDEKATLLGFRR